ncbi:MAG: DNA repair protein RecO [bacterium]
MALQKTEAVILRSVNYSESSRMVEVFSCHHGKMTLVDKGGRRLASKRGRLVPFARMEITYYKSRAASAGYISDSELLELFGFEKEGTMGRLAYASAACELLHHLLSEGQPQPTLYNFFIVFLKLTEAADKSSLPPLFLAFFLQLLVHLGYGPAVANCVGCGQSAAIAGEGNQPLGFCSQRGGFVCDTCQNPGDDYIAIPGEAMSRLAVLQQTSLAQAAAMPMGYNEVSYLLEVLVKFINYQTGTVSRLKSLEFLQKLRDHVRKHEKGNTQT